MARCPAGHESQASDYCDTCGLVIGGEPANTAATALAPAGAASAPAAGPGGVASSAGGGGAGSACPVCQAERNGRFCEECGYDFDLAEAMPHVNMIPGVPPAPSGQQSASSSVSGSSAASAPGGEAPGSGVSQGLDLDAELARAEAEAAAAVATASEAVVNEQEELGGQRIAESSTGASASVSAAEAGRETSPGSETALPVSPPPGPASGLSGLSAGGFDSSEGELSLVINADRDYYKAQIERGDIIESEFPFPKYPSERRFTFPDGPVRIGRASASRGLNPEIDLTGPPLDPAVSHLHAQLLRHPEGWVVVDLGSANGTRLNDAEEPLEAETEIPVKAGDRIHLGVWTTITLQ